MMEVERFESDIEYENWLNDRLDGRIMVDCCIVEEVENLWQ